MKPREHPGSALAGIRALKDRRVRDKRITLRVGDTPVFVTYRAATQSELARLSSPVAAVAESKDTNKRMKANVKFAKALIGLTCVGIYELSADGELASADPEGEAPRFDARLCELFEVPVPPSEAEIVDLVYTEAEILPIALRLQEFAQGGEIEEFEALEGN